MTIFTNAYPCPAKQVSVPEFIQLSEKVFKKSSCSKRLLLFIITVLCVFNSAIAQNTLDNAGLSSSSPSAAAFSLRKLSSAYSGFAIRVRRNSDNSLQDIGFTASGDLDTTALKTFTGAASGFVATWYDQSGNGRNATQGTTASQPRIINAGVLEVQNGKPAIRFSGSQNMLTSLTAVQATAGGNTTTANAVFMSSTVNSSILSNNASTGANRYNIHAPWGDGRTYFDIGDIGASGRISGTYTWGGLSVGTFQRNNATGNIWKNGLNIVTSAAMASTVTSTNAMYIGSFQAASSYMTGAMPELIVFASAISTTERQALECNQFSYYSINDAMPPVVTCPATQSINLTSGCTATMPNYLSLATATDNCTASGSIILTQSPVAGSTISGAGTQVVTITATDLAGNTGNCTFSLSKVDITAPVITCPSDITINASAGICGAAVAYTVSATDACSGSTSCIPSNISSNYTLVGTYGGHTYYRSNFSANWAAAKANAIAVGGHLLTLSSAAENNLFNGLGTHWAGFTDEAAEGTFVWVTGEPVVFTNWAPAEPNDYNGNEDHMQLNWNASYQWNDYNGATTYPFVVEFECVSPTLNLLSGFASGSIFPVGTTTVTYNATDAAGNTSTNCSFTVTVNDATAPVITCPANISVNAAAGACDAIVTYNIPVATDNCGSCSSAPAISGYNSLGVYNGSAYYLSNTPLAASAAFSAASALGASVATINSAAENTFVRNAVNALPFTGSYLIGINDAAVEGTFVGFAGETLLYTNWGGGEPNNSGGNEDYTQVLNSGLWNDFNGSSASNYVIKISCITPVKTSGLASGSTFPLGTSTINYSATDPTGNTSACSFTVTVSINPTSLNRTVTAAAATVCAGNSTNINVALSDNGISYQLRNNADNSAVGSPVSGTGGTISLPTGNLSATTTFNVFATGSSCSYQLTTTVTVTVNPAATITPGSALAACQSATPSAITLSGASVGGGASTGAWSITSGGGTLSSTAQTATPATVTYTPAANFSGTVTLTLTTNDPAGPCGAVAATRTIAVNTLPTNITPVAAATFVCSGSSTDIQIPASQSGVNYQLRNNTGNINIGTAVAGTGSTINLPTGYLTANTTFNVLATNATTSCSRQMTTTVTVTMDNFPPVISCPSSQSINLSSTTCDAVLPDYTTMATVSDNCTATGSITITQSPAPGTTVALSGTVSVTLTATDASGNSSNCVFTVNKLDVTAPVMSCPANITVNTNTALCGAVVTYSVTATDNCNGSSCAPASVSGYTLIGNYNGHTYFRSTASSLWPTAKNNAIAVGAHLVTISSAGENAFLAGLGNHWGGMTDEVTEGTWAWVTGEPIVYTSWNAGEPNNSGGNQDYLVLNYAGTNWDDQGTTTSTTHPSIIEFDCLSTNMVSGFASGSVFPVGTTTVTYNATDAAGNTSSNCSFTVTVNDNIAPSLTCPANISINAATGACDAVVNYTSPVAIDNCGNCSTPPTFTGMTFLTSSNGRAYYISNTNFTWANANTAATNQGGYLAAIDNAAENTLILNEVASKIGSGTNYWIGLNDAATEGTFVWSNGQPFSYSNWQAGQPDNSGGNEDFGHIWTAAGTWNDISPTSTMRYVLELPCVPVTLTSGLASGSTFPLGTSTINYSALDAAGNTSNCSFTVTVSLNPASLNRTVAAASANICINNGTNITIALSDNGVSYQLRNNADNSAIGSPVVGTGGTISLPTGSLTATTTFNVFATGSSCSYLLTNTVTVTVIPLPTDRTPTAVASAVCSGTGTNIQITTSQSGVNYQLRNNATNANVGSAVAGTGGTINLPTGNLTATTTFNVLATTATASCSIQMVNTVAVTVNPLPATPTAGNASRCGTGTVTITATPGAGETIDWYAAATGGTALVTGNTSYTTPSISVTTLYYAQARNTTTGCLSAARRTVTATVNAVPASPTAGNNSRCGTGTVTITATPGAGETIDWYAAASGGTALVTGNASYTTPSIAATTSYFAQARNTTTGCLAAARTTVTATINAIPVNKTFTAAATVCSGSSINIQVASSDNGVNYQLRNNTGNVNIGSPVAGTGGTINLPTGNLTSATTFNILATNATSGCNLQMTGTVTVNINPLPTDKTPTAVSSSICSGTDATIQIAASQSGVSYQLRNNTGNTNMGSAVAGTGGTITLLSGAITASTTFNVLATNTTTGCNVQMVNTVNVTVNPSGQWIGGSSGNWNTAANWCGGVPTATTNVNIPASTTVNIQSANAVANSVTIAGTGSLVMTGAYNLNITAGGTFTNNGTFTTTSSTGTVAFLGSGVISGTTTFKNIDTYGALDFGTASTVSGTLSLQTGGSVTGNSPTYTCPTAVLAYKPGSTFTRGLEWTNSSSGAGYPANVIIQNNTTINFPSGGDGYVCYDLTIDNGSSLLQDFSGGSAALRVGRNVNITGTLSLGNSTGGDIYVGGNWIRNTGGVFNANNRLVTFDGPSNFSGNGTSMSTITAPASAAKDNEGGFGGEKFSHLWINKTSAADSVVLLSNITVNRELGLTSGTFSLRNNDVTIVSNSTRTADIAPITTPANVNIRYAGTGKFVIQRFIQNPTGVRSWRLLTAPLQDATAPTINEAWQEGVVNPDRTNPNGSGGIYNPWPGYGTHISGPGGTYNLTNGFDHGTNTASILHTNSGITAWTWPSSTKATKITAQQGWMIFIRGDRSFTIGNQYVPSQNTTLEPKGRINTGNVAVTVATGKQIVGNPYASAISLLDVDIAGTAGKNSSYYMWDPKMFTSYTQPGKWVTFTGVGNSFVQTTSESPYLANGTVESGQAFVVDAAVAGTVTFRESDKQALTSSLVGIANATGSRPTANPVFAMFRSDVYAKNDTTYKLTDAVVNIFSEDYTNAADEADAKKFISFNTKESLSILRDTIKMAIEKRNDITENDTVFFSMTKFNLLPYQFRFTASNFVDGYEAFLEDRYTGISTTVSMYGETIVDFTINADSLSKAENRFKVVFKKRNLIVLPVTLTSINATRKDKNVLVSWTVENEVNLSGYEIEKSSDGNNFTKVGSKPANNHTSAAYNFTDEHVYNGMNFYRIKMIDRNGQFKYSTVVYISMNKKGTITVYPNPVVNNTVQLLMAGQEKGNYQLTIYNSNGQNVSSHEFDCNGTDAVKAIRLNNTLPKGIYNAEVILPDGKKTTIQIAVQ